MDRTKPAGRTVPKEKHVRFMRILDVQTSPLRPYFLPVPLNVSCRRPWNSDGGKRFLHPESGSGWLSPYYFWRTILVCCVWRSICRDNWFLCLFWKRNSHISRPHGFFRYSCKEMNAVISRHMGHGLDWTILALWNYSSRFLTFSLLRVVDQDFSLGVVCGNSILDFKKNKDLTAHYLNSLWLFDMTNIYAAPDWTVNSSTLQYNKYWVHYH